MRVVLVLAGVLLAVVALVLLLGNERQAARATAAFDGIGGAVVDLGERAPAGNVDGRLVRVVGTTRVTRAAQDPQFAITAANPALVRHVEMLQWYETTFASEASYEVRWMDQAVDSRRFRQPRGHENPGDFPFEGRRFEAAEVQLGQFALAPALIRAIPGTEPIKVDIRRLPANLAASLQADGDGLTSAADPRSPRLGDLRLHWTVVPNQTLTVLARVHGGRLEPAATLPAPGFVMMLDDMPMMGLLPGQPRPPEHAAVMRVLAAVLLLLASGLLLLGIAGRRRFDIAAWLALAGLPFTLALAWSWWDVRAAVVVIGMVLALAAVGVLLRYGLRR